MAKLDAGSCILNIHGDTLSEVEIDRLVDILVKRQARLPVKSPKNTPAKIKKEALLVTLAARLSEV